MALTLRLVKGSALTYQEADDNFSGLADGSLFTGQSLVVGGSLANDLRIAGAASSVAPSIVAEGTDLNIGIYYATKGSGRHFFAGGPNQWDHFIVDSTFDTGAGGNQLVVRGATAGNPPTITVDGGDANAGLFYSTKGAGAHAFATGGGGTQVVIANTYDVVNQIQLTGAATGSAPSVMAIGADSSINLNFVLKGLASFIFTQYDGLGSRNIASISSEGQLDSSRKVLQFFGEGGGRIEFGSSDLLFSRESTTALRLESVVSSVNYLSIAQSSAGNPVSVSAFGDDTNVELRLSAKGSSPIISMSDLEIRGASAPAVVFSDHLTTDATHANKMLVHSSADNNPRTVTLDHSVGYRKGTMFTIFNAANTITLTITGGGTLKRVGDAATGSRTLSANNYMNVLKVDDSADWWVAGATG